ncbi:MAG: peptidase A24 [Alphaproteobacteria bacterium]|nr:MAG: peptidase A24 [Alphaproteobacteria bacterium]
MQADLLWPGGLTILLAYAAFSDIKWRRLPNWLSLTVLAYGFAWAFTQGGLPALGWHGAHAAIALAVGIALFATGGFGGGDAKLYTGTAACFALQQGVALLLWVSLTGLVTMLGWIILKRLPPFSSRKREGNFAKFPYGVAIALGGSGLAWAGPLTA